MNDQQNIARQAEECSQDEANDTVTSESYGMQLMQATGLCSSDNCLATAGKDDLQTSNKTDRDDREEFAKFQDDSASVVHTPRPINQQWFTTRDDKSCMQNQGIKWKQGMWSREEETLLRENILNYCKERALEDAATVIFLSSKEERKTFYRTIAKGILRPLFAIYRKVLRMYDSKNYIGKYSDDELERLKDLKLKHGNDWATIGCALGRSASSVKDRCRLIKCNKRLGKWSSDEEQLLSGAIHEHTKTRPGESVTAGIAWSTIAAIVATRTEKQCRSKWLNYLNWKESAGQLWTKSDEVELIKRISISEVSDETDIDWAKIASDWSSARSPQWLRSKWWCMKRKVPDHGQMPFQELMAFLQTGYMENLRVKLDRQTACYQSSVQSNDSCTLQMTPTSTTVIGSDLVHGALMVTKADQQHDGIATATNSPCVGLQGYQLQFHLGNDCHPVLLQSLPVSNPVTALSDQYVIHHVDVSSVLPSSSAAHFDEQQQSVDFVTSSSAAGVACSTSSSADHDVQFAQAMVQTDLSIPIPCSEMSRDSLTAANLEAINGSMSVSLAMHPPSPSDDIGLHTQQQQEQSYRDLDDD